jgi:K+-transporting ATPase A subunit
VLLARPTDALVIFPVISYGLQMSQFMTKAFTKNAGALAVIRDFEPREVSRLGNFFRKQETEIRVD